jgi:hypothetical protein
MRELKFRVWNKATKSWLNDDAGTHCWSEYCLNIFTGEVVEIVTSDNKFFSRANEPNFYFDKNTHVKESPYVVQQYTGLPYSQNKSVNDSQGASSMAGDPFKSPLLDLMAPSTRPDEPITAGINSGPGGGTELMRGMPDSMPNVMDTLKTIMQFDTSGDVELLFRTLTDNGYGD